MAFSFILHMWKQWNIRGIVMLSLLLQAFLILLAPLRKKTMNYPILFFLWLAYLMADWVAAFGIGLISENQGRLPSHAIEVDEALQAFWASFLLLHLGGPDTITAFSLEDSSLWRRHLLTLTFQVCAAIYVFVQIFLSDKSLVIPTMLVFLAGVIKNVERLLALNLSSLPKLRESMLSQQEFSYRTCRKLIKDLSDQEEGYSDGEEAKLAESVVVKHAYCLFHIFKVFLVDLIFTRMQRKKSREYFYKVSAMDALRVISVELHFIYEVLHTKTLAIRSHWSYVFRCISFIFIMMAFILFNRLKRHGLLKLDVEITYCLLFGGIALDVMALFTLVFSDWTVAKIMWYNRGSYKPDSFLFKLMYAADELRKPRFAKFEVKPNANVTYEVLDTPLIFRRWSESICACNIFSEILKESPREMYKRDQHRAVVAFSNIYSFPSRMTKKIISCFYQVRNTITGGHGAGVRTHGKPMIANNPITGEDDAGVPIRVPIHGKPMIANMKYVTKNPFVKKLWIFIFMEVRRKAINTKRKNMRTIFEARGNLFLKNYSREIDCNNLLSYVNKTNYDASVVMWHIATEICYNLENPTTKSEERDFSKILSDYMLYLLLNEPNVVSAVKGIVQMISADTLRELQNHVSDATNDVEGLCLQLFEDPQRLLAKDKPSKSVLKQGTELAWKMQALGEMKWKVMSGVWAEMLSYAAIHVRGEAHVQVLSKGGELLAFVWLLMAHFGCFYKPEWGVFYEYWDGEFHLRDS